MKVISDSNENEMILCFLKGELESKRFNSNLLKTLKDMNLDSLIISKADLKSDEDNNVRKEIMKKYRGYPDSDLFNNFPKNIDWKYVQFEQSDIENIYYINYDYWNELSNDTSKPLEAAKNIRDGKEIYGVSNKPFLSFSFNEELPPVILLTCNNEKYLIIEGHSRMTIYGLNPVKFIGTYGYIGYTSEKEMGKYDSRMVLNKKI